MKQFLKKNKNILFMSPLILLLAYFIIFSIIQMCLLAPLFMGLLAIFTLILWLFIIGLEGWITQ